MMAKTMARMSQAVFLSFTSIKQLCTMGWISAGRCPIAGYVPSTATLNIIVCADRPGQSGRSPNASVTTPPRAYMSQLGPMLSPFSCSGAWKPGVPAFMVEVPIAALVVRICPSPKSAKKTWSDTSSTYITGSKHPVKQLTLYSLNQRLKLWEEVGNINCSKNKADDFYLTRMFAGLRSRCTTAGLEVCINTSAWHTCFIKWSFSS